MRHVAATIDIAAPTDRVWPFLAEFARWPQWGLSISDVHSTSEYVAPGVTGRVRTRVGLWLPFTIEDVIPESFWDWSIVGFRATGHYLEPRQGHTHVRFTAPGVAAPYKLVMAASLERLKHLVESQ